MTRTNLLRSLSCFGLAAALFVFIGGSAQARPDVAAMTQIEIDRDAADLKDEIRPRPKDIDVADTVLVFTSTNRFRTAVYCVARNRSGKAIGRSVTWVPGDGVKYILASDLSNGQDFVGSVKCSHNASFIPTAIFLGPQITDLPTHVGSHEGKINIRFPLVATY